MGEGIRRSAPLGVGRNEEVGDAEINEARFALYNELIEPYRDASDSDSDENLARGYVCYLVAYGDDVALLEKPVPEMREVIEARVRTRIATSSPAETRAWFEAIVASHN